jgi:hypothetical protein
MVVRSSSVTWSSGGGSWPSGTTQARPLSVVPSSRSGIAIRIDPGAAPTALGTIRTRSSTLSACTIRSSAVRVLGKGSNA